MLKQYRQSGDSGSFSSQDRGAKSHPVPTGGQCRGAFVRRPATFGTDKQMDGLHGRRFSNRRDQRSATRLLIKQEAETGGRELSGEGRGQIQDRQLPATALLACFADEPEPTIMAFRRSRFETAITELGNHRADSGNSEFDGFLQHPFEVVELEECGNQVDARGQRRGGAVFEHLKPDAVLACLDDFGQHELPVVGDLHPVTLLDAQDASEVMRVVALQFGLIFVDAVDKEEAFGHVRFGGGR